jgi:hypothetical protein
MRPKYRSLLTVGGETTSVTIEAQSVAGVLHFRALSPPKKECACEKKVRIKPTRIRKIADACIARVEPLIESSYASTISRRCLRVERVTIRKYRDRGYE